MSYNTQAFIRMVKHPVKFGLFLLSKLPAAYFSGLKVIDADEASASVAVPYKWFTTNPFKSTYFACLAMAAEMSTGLLAMMYIYKRRPALSMLVVKTEANYIKKATGKTIFICTAGEEFSSAIEEAIASGESKTITVESIGKNISGELVASFLFTWSFKIKAAK